MSPGAEPFFYDVQLCCKNSNRYTSVYVSLYVRPSDVDRLEKNLIRNIRSAAEFVCEALLSGLPVHHFLYGDLMLESRRSPQDTTTDITYTREEEHDRILLTKVVHVGGVFADGAKFTSVHAFPRGVRSLQDGIEEY